MKPLKRYTIENGQVVECRVFGTESFYVHANTKTAALEEILRRVEHVTRHQSRLFIKNGAYCHVYPDIHTNKGGWAFETGSLSRTNKDGELSPLCSGQCDGLKDGEHNSSFNYYASEEFQKEDTTP